MLANFFHTQKLRFGFCPFYRRFPYRGRLPVIMADQRGVFDSELGIFYNRIPKVANSSIVKGLLNLKVSKDISVTSYKKAFKQPSRMSRGEVDRLGRMVKFVFVRNPYTRLLSAYLDKVVRVGYFSPGGKLAGEALSRRNRTPTFSDFCTWLEDGGLHRNAHWAPQSSLLLLPLEHFDFVGKFENLDEDFKLLQRRIIGKCSELERRGPPATDAGSLLDQYYKPLDYQRVESLYAEDFSRFFYKKR